MHTPQLADNLRRALLQAAIEGKLTERQADDGHAQDLLKQIQAEKAAQIQAGRLKKSKGLPEIGEDEKPFAIPENWVWVRLGEIGQIIGGGTPKTTHSEYWNDGSIPWITPADMRSLTSRYIEKGARNITQKGLESSSARLLPKGSVLFSSRAPIGYVAIAKAEMATNQGFKSIVPFQEAMNEYLYYVLLAFKSEIEKLGTGTTFKEVSGAVVGNVAIPLPPLAEQARIVAKLDALLAETDALKAQETALADAQKSFPKMLRASLLQAAIEGKLTEQESGDGHAQELLQQIQAEKAAQIQAGRLKKSKGLPEISEDEKPFAIPENWVWVRLGEVIFLKSGQDLTPSEYSSTADGVPYITGASHFNNGQLNISRWTKFPRSVAEKGSLLFTCKGTVGEMAFLQEEKAHIARQVMAITSVGNKVELAFIKIILQSYVTQIKASAKSMIPGVGRDDLLLLPIPLPPLAEQARIVAKLDALLAQIESLENLS
ncbi:restriction endonuclease subunit S [Moraxella sp. VT-16-12]|uniref:restriction endonuclease subunit S n=1 Tax=Moraxella sp. VT-16-12 TaxID=2014877 RepID=UPI000B7D3DA1|nr:restriction endonuclease subunit S [Moraxella sp. VT-16-12]TWV84628.1 restriction endonuclease subunit S [Moraxella sp. VT-16-12]